MYRGGSAPKNDQLVDAADLNTRECPQESKKKSKEGQKVVVNPIKRILKGQTVRVKDYKGLGGRRRKMGREGIVQFTFHGVL